MEQYNVAEDFSQSVDLAAVYPKKLAELRALFEIEAQRYGYIHCAMLLLDVVVITRRRTRWKVTAK